MLPEGEKLVKQAESIRKIRKNVMRAVVRSAEMLLLPLFFCLVLECAASAKGKAYVAVFYRTFEDSEDPEAAKIRAALNEALTDAGITYQEYNGADDPEVQMAQIESEKDAMLFIVNPADQDSGDIAADIVTRANGKPLIFFDCEISKETAETAEDLCVLVNAAEPQAEAETETETEITRAEIIAAELPSEAETIALIAGNYMTGAGYFEGIEADWVTDGWRVDVP